MPILILLGIGAIFGIASIKEELTPSNPPASRSDLRTRQILANNQKRIDRIMRKYR